MSRYRITEFGLPGAEIVLEMDDRLLMISDANGIFAPEDRIVVEAQMVMEAMTAFHEWLGSNVIDTITSERIEE